MRTKDIADDKTRKSIFLSKLALSSMICFLLSFCVPFIVIAVDYSEFEIHTNTFLLLLFHFPALFWVVGLVIGVWAVRTAINKKLSFAILIVVGGLTFVSLPLTQEYVFRRAPQARRHLCVSNLKKIGVALHIYAQDNNGIFPEDLKTFAALYPKYIKVPKIFLCPSDKNNKAWPTEINNWKTDQDNSCQISYTYISGFGVNDVDRVIVKDNTIENHGGKGLYALYGDGHIEWIPVPGQTGDDEGVQ